MVFAVDKGVFFIFGLDGLRINGKQNKIRDSFCRLSFSYTVDSPLANGHLSTTATSRQRPPQTAATSLQRPFSSFPKVAFMAVVKTTVSAFYCVMFGA